MRARGLVTCRGKWRSAMDIDEFPVTTAQSCEELNPRQLVDYEHHRRAFIEWLWSRGKQPDHHIGYSRDTVRFTAYRTDRFYRWVWDRRGYTTDVTHEDADDYADELARDDTSIAHKRKCVMVLKRLFTWRAREHGGEEWSPSVTFTRQETATTPRDYLTRDERQAIREAALEYGAVPNYKSVSPEKRSRYKRYLAQRFGKPIEDVTPDDFDRANGWKIPSLVWVSMDAGLRPVEVERASVRWCDVENGVLRIPKADSAKTRENWVVGLRDRTAEMLRRWLDQREAEPLYDETDSLWLTREANPYQTASLKYVLNRLCDIADISTDHRSLSWYAIRHSVGTYMTREEDLAAAQAQLRHKSPETTMKYDQTPVEDRRDALERM